MTAWGLLQDARDFISGKSSMTRCVAVCYAHLESPHSLKCPLTVSTSCLAISLALVPMTSCLIISLALVTTIEYW